MRAWLVLLLLSVLGLPAALQAQSNRARSEPYKVPKMFVEAIRRKDCKFAVEVVNDLLQARDPTAGCSLWATCGSAPSVLRKIAPKRKICTLRRSLAIRIPTQRFVWQR